jgi:ABC-type lipoprotein export system ATPase subunit
MIKKIVIKGAKEHNLKNVSVEIPKDQFVVITGLSGSGKSSLAFDTIYAEGQRRYVESLSAYARQFLDKMKKPNVDLIEGLVNVVQQYLKKGAQIYVEGQITTRKWKDEQSGQDKYSTEIVIQGYNSSLTMLGGGNSGGGIQNDTSQAPTNNFEDAPQVSNDMDDEIPF